MDGCLVCLPDSDLHRVTNTKCRINKVIFPDDGHIVARNMQRKEINVLKKLCTKLALFTRLYKNARPKNIKKIALDCSKLMGDEFEMTWKELVAV